jgi:hypothetical protein
MIRDNAIEEDNGEPSTHSIVVLESRRLRPRSPPWCARDLMPVSPLP